MNEVIWGKGGGVRWKKVRRNGYLGEVSGGKMTEEKLEEGDNSRTRISVND